ncbi:unnamed protein product [Clonostachys solani]|uniref:NWD NACHT-NTPase N-terminal domain-containing protein n=1 Tax=Clonostachys solani TaxID=160281 RepID=A0A9N9ZGX2_9HYPO|nr:unnamed protein product [Clonostachys solani]
MAPRWFKKVESKAKKLLSHSAPSPSPSLITSQPASGPVTQVTSQSTPSPPTSIDTETLPLLKRLWNQAYDDLKASEPKLIEAYKKILLVGLHRKDLSSITCESTENEIEGALVGPGWTRPDVESSAALEAAIAWVSVCLRLEILLNPVTEVRDNCKGIAYVLSKIE